MTNLHACIFLIDKLVFILSLINTRLIKYSPCAFGVAFSVNLYDTIIENISYNFDEHLTNKNTIKIRNNDLLFIFNFVTY